MITDLSEKEPLIELLKKSKEMVMEYRARRGTSTNQEYFMKILEIHQPVFEIESNI